MPKSRPQIFDFLDSLTARLNEIGKDNLAFSIKAAYSRGPTPVETQTIIDILCDELDESEQLSFQFAA